MDILTYALTNALVAGILGLLVVVTVRPHKHPRAARALWLLVLAKLLLPPLVPLSLPVTWRVETATPPVTSSATNVQSPVHNAPYINENELAAMLPAAVDTQVLDFDIAPIIEPHDLSVASRDISTHWAESRPPIDGDAARASTAAASATETETVGTTAVPSLNARQLLVGAWLFGTSIWLLVIGTRMVRFERWLRLAGAAPASATRLTAMIEEAAARLQLTRLPQLVIVPGNVPPLVWPIGRGGQVVVPATLIDSLSRWELRLVLAHELAHLRRRDHWVRWFEAAVTGLYWWHPIVWLARRELRTAEEIGCDQLVLRVFSPSASRTYGEALVKTSDFVTTCSRASYAMASGFVRPSPLKRRIEMIVRPASSSYPLRVATLAAFAAVIALLPLSIDFAPAQEPAAAGALAQEYLSGLPDAPAQEPVEEDAIATQLPVSIDFAPGQEPAGEVDEVVQPGEAAGAATRATQKPFADANRIERYRSARTLANAIEFCRTELRNNGKTDYVALVNEERVLAAIRTAMNSYVSAMQDTIAARPDDRSASERYAYYRQTIRPKLEQILNERRWPRNSYFNPIPALEDERGVRHDGFRLRLEIETPGDTFDGFGLPVLDVMYGQFAGRASRDERSQAATVSPSVRRLQILIADRRARLQEAKVRLDRLASVNLITPDAISAKEMDEQQARVRAAETDLDILLVSLEEAAEEAEQKSANAPVDAQTINATGESVTVRKLRAQIKAKRAQLEVEMAKMNGLLEVDRRRPGTVSKIKTLEQRARVTTARSELEVLLLTLQEAAPNISRGVGGETSDARPADATGDRSSRRSETDDTAAAVFDLSRDGAIGPIRQIELTPSGIRMLVHDKPITKIRTSYPQFISVESISPTHIQLTGKKVGIAQLTFWDEDEKPTTVNVRVVDDPRAEESGGEDSNDT